MIWYILWKDERVNENRNHGQFHLWTGRRESCPDPLRAGRNGTAIEQRKYTEKLVQRNATERYIRIERGTVCAKFPRDSTRTAPILYRVTNGSSIVRKHFSFPGRRMNGVMDYRNRSCAPRSRRDMELIEPRVSLSCGFLVNGINTTKRIMRYLATNYSRSQWWIALRTRTSAASRYKGSRVHGYTVGPLATIIAKLRFPFPHNFSYRWPVRACLLALVSALVLCETEKLARWKCTHGGKRGTISDRVTSWGQDEDGSIQYKGKSFRLLWFLLLARLCFITATGASSDDRVGARSSAIIIRGKQEVIIWDRVRIPLRNFSFHSGSLADLSISTF